MRLGLMSLLCGLMILLQGCSEATSSSSEGNFLPESNATAEHPAKLELIQNFPLGVKLYEWAKSHNSAKETTLYQVDTAPNQHNIINTHGGADLNQLFDSHMQTREQIDELQNSNFGEWVLQNHKL